jgi:Na+/H+ antiporter NhaD/arsenite permease-like protein
MVDVGAAHFDGVGISVLWSLPFAGLLLSIALLPLLTPHFWEHHFCKVAAFWVLAFLVPCAVAAGFSIAAQAVLHTFLLDYVPFILLLFTLFVVAGLSVPRSRIRRCWPSALYRRASSARPAPRWC